MRQLKATYALGHGARECALVLIQSLVGESFVHPAEILWIYKLRSSVVHGSRIDVAGEVEYERMLDATRATLKSYIDLVAKNHLKNFAELTNFIESSTVAQQLLEWLRSHDEDDNIRELKKALHMAVSESRQTTS